MKKTLLMAISIFVLTACGGVNVGNTPVIDIITASSPADGATGIDVTRSITVYFRGEVDPTTVNSGNIFLTKTAGGVLVPGTITYDNVAMSITFTPLFPMIAGASYVFTITSGVLTKAIVDGEYKLSFQTKMSPILYVTNLDPANPAATTGYNIWSYDPDTGARTNLTSYSTGTAFDPVWSPDHEQISYTYGLSADPNEIANDSKKVDVFVMNADGTGQTNLTNLTGNALALNPTWYPDGSSIYMQLRPDGGNYFNINSVDPVGGSLTNVTNRPLGETTASNDFGYDFIFSPEGTQLLYPVRNDSTSTIDLHVIGPDGSGDLTITDVGVRNEAGIGAFSADGTKVYFSLTVSVPSSGNIYSVMADGSGLTNISGGSTEQSYKMIALFPDETKILSSFGYLPVPGLPRVYDLYVIAVDGSLSTALTSATALEMATKAFLSPDGGLVAYGFGVPDSLVDLYIIGSDGSSNMKITSLVTLQSLLNAIWSPDGDRVVYSYSDIRPVGGGYDNGRIFMVGSDGSGSIDVSASTVGDAWLGDWW